MWQQHEQHIPQARVAYQLIPAGGLPISQSLASCFLEGSICSCDGSIGMTLGYSLFMFVVLCLSEVAIPYHIAVEEFLMPRVLQCTDEFLSNSGLAHVL